MQGVGCKLSRWACPVYLSGQPAFWGEIFVLVADEAEGKALRQVALSEYTGVSYLRATAMTPRDLPRYLEMGALLDFVPKPGRALRPAATKV